MPPLVEVNGIRNIVRDAKAVAAVDFLDELSGAWRQAERLVLARMEARAAATGRRADVKVADTLRGTMAKDRAAVRFGGAQIPWAMGATFGAYQDRTRTGRRRGPYEGYRQFPEPRRDGGWPYQGLEDARDDIVELVAAEMSRLLDRRLT